MQNQSSQQFNGCKATNSKHFILREKFVYGSIKKKDSSLMMVDQSQVFLLGKKDYGLYDQYLRINTWYVQNISKPLSYSTRFLNAHV